MSNLTLKGLEDTLSKLRDRDPRTWAEMELVAAVRHLPIETLNVLVGCARRGIFDGMARYSAPLSEPITRPSPEGNSEQV